jgi:mRNA-degrading endonuclease RelE of RelBE toxin-antitoxin system
LDAALKKIFAGYPIRFTTESFAWSVRFPRTHGRLGAGSENDWRIRVGDYRVIYEIADANRIVRINRVRHRKEVYR